MKKTLTTSFLALFAACFCAGALGLVNNPNPNLTMTIVSGENFTVKEANTFLPGFAVRITDPQGAPIPGLVVDFFTNRYLCAPLLPCNLPAEGTYGRFVDGIEDQMITTDSNGIARSAGYFTGTVSGTYQVAAPVLCLSSAKNCDVLKLQQGPTAYFTITQSIFAIDGYMSGNWYNPARSGQGFQLEFTAQNNTLVAIWFVFGPNGGQNWIMAQGPYDITRSTVTVPAVMLSGAKFPPLFNSADVQSTPWGTLTFSFVDCDHGTVQWNSTIPGYGTGTMDITRLTSIRGTKCPGS